MANSIETYLEGHSRATATLGAVLGGAIAVGATEQAFKALKEGEHKKALQCAAGALVAGAFSVASVVGFEQGPISQE